ncbi:MAG TPA: serine/threonine-protein kinase [Polyangiaceae bacterium]|jgi:serine/threonine-protein kinase
MSFTPTTGLDEGSLTSIIGSSGMSYRHVRELGHGGMARIFLAYAVGSGGFTKLVVLKMLRKELSADPAVRQMFQAEARLSARLNHPNLVQVYEVVEGDSPFLVMEYLAGQSLSAIRKGGFITAPMLLAIISEALVGLHHAHTLTDFDGSPLNIVHRDVSPHNTFVTYDGAVKVLDFGIAKMGTTSSNTDVREVQGKVTYMAPEQLLGEDVDCRADIFSAGCVLWEAAVGRRMWEDMSEAMLMHRLASGSIPLPSDKADIDPELEAIIRKATAPARGDRYSTALEMQRDLLAYSTRAYGPVSMRDVGEALAGTFKEERERERKALLAALRQSPPDRDTTPGDAVVSVKPPPPHSRAQRAAMAIFLVLFIGGAVVWRSRSLEPPAPSAPAAPSLVSVSVRATPPETTIEIDGQRRATEAFVMRVARDSADHPLKASAPGYLPQAQLLKFDRDQDVEIFLQRVPEPRPSASPPARKLPRAAAPAPKSQEHACDPPYYFVDGIKTYRPECL